MSAQGMNGMKKDIVLRCIYFIYFTIDATEGRIHTRRKNRSDTYIFARPESKCNQELLSFAFNIVAECIPVAIA